MKTWDNLGRTRFVFDAEALDSDLAQDPELENLPSWIPDWTRWSSKDSEPLPSLTDEELRYWSSGKLRQVHFASDYDSNSSSLKLTGVLFDRITRLARPWTPEPHLLPVDRLQNKTLQEWESLATMPILTVPMKIWGDDTMLIGEHTLLTMQVLGVRQTKTRTTSRPGSTAGHGIRESTMISALQIKAIGTRSKLENNRS